VGGAAHKFRDLPHGVLDVGGVAVPLVHGLVEAAPGAVAAPVAPQSLGLTLQLAQHGLRLAVEAVHLDGGGSHLGGNDVGLLGHFSPSGAASINRCTTVPQVF